MELYSNPVNRTTEADPTDFPIYIMTDDLVLPEKGTFYVIADDGVWLRKDTGLVTGWVKVQGIGALGKIKPTVGLHLPIVPLGVLFQSLAFFRAIYEKYKTEAILLLLFSPSRDMFGLFAPRQQVWPAKIKYDPSDCKPHEDCVVAGSLHSHCSMSAFHSSRDEFDEADFDGLHVTLGNVNDNSFSISVCISLNNNRARIDPTKYFDGLLTGPSYASSISNQFIGFRASSSTVNEFNTRYTLNLTPEEAKSYWHKCKKIIKGWARKVEPQSFFSGNSGWQGHQAKVYTPNNPPPNIPLLDYHPHMTGPNSPSMLYDQTLSRSWEERERQDRENRERQQGMADGGKPDEVKLDDLDDMNFEGIPE